MHAQAHSHQGWDTTTPPPPAARLPRESKEETRSRCAATSTATRPRLYRQLLGLGRNGNAAARGERERALMRAVLVDAIRCLAGEVTPLADRARMAAEARWWVTKRDARWPYSFQNICLGLGLDPGRVRTLLLGSAEEPKAIYERLTKHNLGL